ncbi:MAG: 16S rRNA (cytidine(1402)-2'-O)-methyltransferase [Candidatus Falkowbacteria bacterium]|nr:16S rRNA (cytidine(1402)-2'-O)-methyltransferase [Candidatus Falkowbacteria bacterium]
MSLFVVGTPIGNLEDLSFRAVRVLKEADYVLCEDTRVTRNLLAHYEIKTPTISYHQHSGLSRTDQIISWLKAEKSLALVSDAGTPGISDPGAALVELVRKECGEEVLIESVPGPSALAAAISIAGVGCDRFLFLGFLPHKKGRQTMLKQIVASEYPAVVYESKHRVFKLLNELIALQENFQVTICRELTKKFESVYRGSPEKLLAAFEADAVTTKGEFVLIIGKEKKQKTK